MKFVGILIVTPTYGTCQLIQWRLYAMDIPKLKLLQALEECNKHIKRMLYAYHNMATFLQLDATKYDDLTEEQVENIDQFIFRFSKS
jgi:hypothetical protein